MNLAWTLLDTCRGVVSSHNPLRSRDRHVTTAMALLVDEWQLFRRGPNSNPDEVWVPDRLWTRRRSAFHSPAALAAGESCRLFCLSVQKLWVWRKGRPLVHGCQTGGFNHSLVLLNLHVLTFLHVQVRQKIDHRVFENVSCKTCFRRTFRTGQKYFSAATLLQFLLMRIEPLSFCTV